MSCRRLLLGLLLGAATASAAPHETTRLTASAPDRPAYVQALRDALPAAGIHHVVVDGRAVDARRLAPADLPLPAAVGAYAFPPNVAFRGTEQRWIVFVDGAGAFPVALSLTGGDLLVHVGGELPPPAPAPDAATLQATYGIGALLEERSPWDGPTRAALAAALSRLGPDELRAVAALPFVRSPRTEREVAVPAGFAGAGPGALYEVAGKDTARILVFDRALDHDGLTFAGPVDAPIPASSAAVLHEIGHAFADLPARRLVEQLVAEREALTAGGATASRVDAWKARAARVDVLRGNSPVVAAWSGVPGALAGPTPYGATAPAESFAEAFAMWRTDPDALRRVCPACAAWFEGGGHVRALEQALASP